MRKTLKRETAILLIIALVCMSIFAMVGDDPALVTARTGIVTALAIPILGFAAAAFVCHSFVTDGRIQFLGDCTHDLAGHTVELPDLAAVGHGDAL